MTATPVEPKLTTGTRSLSGLKLELGMRLTLAESDVMGSPRTNVYPSGAAFATCSVPMVPPAPGRLSMRTGRGPRSEEHTSELQSHLNLVCRLLLEKKKNIRDTDLT